MLTPSVRPVGPKGRHVKHFCLGPKVHADSFLSTPTVNAIIQNLPFLASFDDPSQLNVLQMSTIEQLSAYTSTLVTLRLGIIASDLGVFAAINALTNLQSLTVHHHSQGSHFHIPFFKHGLRLLQLCYFEWICKNIVPATYQPMVEFFALCIFHEDVTVVLDMNMDPEFDDLMVERMIPFFIHNKIRSLELREASWALQRLVARQRIHRHLVIQQSVQGMPDLDFLLIPTSTPLLLLKLHFSAYMVPIYLSLLVEAFYLQRSPSDALDKRRVKLDLGIHVGRLDEFDSPGFQLTVEQTLADYRRRIQRTIEFDIGFEVIID